MLSAEEAQKIQNGFDLGTLWLTPRPQAYLAEIQVFEDHLYSLSTAEKVSALLEFTADESQAFKSGVFQFLNFWAMYQTSLKRVHSQTIPATTLQWDFKTGQVSQTPKIDDVVTTHKNNSNEKKEQLLLLPSPETLLLCTECKRYFRYSEITQHHDEHFRFNRINSFLQDDVDWTTFYTKKKTVDAKMLTIRKGHQLMKMLQEPTLKNATRKRILTELNPVKSHEPSEMKPSRGWFSTASVWTKAPMKNVPHDIIQYGKMITPEGYNFWKETFPNTRIDETWLPFLHLSIKDGEVRKTDDTMVAVPLDRPNGFETRLRNSRKYLEPMSAQELETLVRATDQYDERICAICGEGFEVVLSGDPVDLYDDDYILLHAVFDKRTKQPFHSRCFVMANTTTSSSSSFSSSMSAKPKTLQKSDTSKNNQRHLKQTPSAKKSKENMAEHAASVVVDHCNEKLTTKIPKKTTTSEAATTPHKSDHSTTQKKLPQTKHKVESIPNVALKLAKTTTTTTTTTKPAPNKKLQSLTNISKNPDASCALNQEKDVPSNALSEVLIDDHEPTSSSLNKSSTRKLSKKEVEPLLKCKVTTVLKRVKISK